MTPAKTPGPDGISAGAGGFYSMRYEREGYAGSSAKLPVYSW